jgi:hypothetical protein
MHEEYELATFQGVIHTKPRRFREEALDAVDADAEGKIAIEKQVRWLTNFSECWLISTKVD